MAETEINTLDKLVAVSNALYALKEELGSIKNAMMNTTVFISAHAPLIDHIARYENRVAKALSEIKESNVKDFDEILKRNNIKIKVEEKKHADQ